MKKRNKQRRPKSDDKRRREETLKRLDRQRRKYKDRYGD